MYKEFYVSSIIAMWFISKFKECCGDDDSIPSFLRRDEAKKELKQLLNLYKESNKLDEDAFLIDRLSSYEIVSESSDKQITRRNLVEVIEKLYNGKLMSKSTAKRVREILISKIKEYQGHENPVRSNVFIEVYLLFQLSPTLVEVESIFVENLTIDWYDWFFYFCIESEDNRPFFNKLLEQYIKLFEIAVTKNEYEYFFLGEDKCLNYIVTNQETNEKFLVLLSKNPWTLRSLFGLYYSEGKEKPFLIGNKTYVQDCIWILINEYYERKLYRNDRIFKQKLFQLVINSQCKETEFVTKLFTYLNHWNHQYFSITPIILKWLLNEENIDNFLKFKRWNRTILDLYYSFKNDWNQILLEKIYQNYQSIIDKNDEYIQESREKVTQEEENIKLQIKEIIDNNIQLKETTKLNYFVSSILFLYKEHKDLFEDYQKNFVKDQIHLYFTSEDTNPWNSKLWIEYSKENSFSWPWFIQDLNLCVEIALYENIDLSKYKERVVYLIPYLFDWDYRKLVEGFDKNLRIIDGKLIDWILDVYSHKSNKGLWYLHPSRLISLLRDNILSTKDFTSLQVNILWEICKNMIQSTESRISVWDKKIYCNFLVNNKDNRIDVYWLIGYYEQEIWKYKEINYFDDYLRHNIKEEKGFELFLEVNKSLILLFKNKNAIDWRFSQLLWIKKDFYNIEYVWVRGISELEKELTYWNNEDDFFYSVLLEVLKYPENKDQVDNILNRAQELWKKSKFKWYLYNFIANYYKNIPEEDKAEVYANIDDKDFVYYYLGIVDWDYTKKLEYQFLKWSLSKKNLIRQIEEKDKKIYDANQRIDQLTKQVKIKNLEVAELSKYKVLIFTEWKSDWKHLIGIAERLKELKPNNKKIYQFVIDYLVKYDCDTWDSFIIECISKLWKIYEDGFKNVKILLIVDPDWEDKLLKDYEPESCDSIKKPEAQNQNCRLIILTDPRKKEKYKDFYDEHRWCIELLYSKRVLKNRFIIPRDIKMEDCNKFSVSLIKIKYKGKILYIKTSDDNKKLRNVYDRNVKCIYDSKFNKMDTKALAKLWIASKDEFAGEIYEKEISRNKLTYNDIKNFDVLFQTIYKAWQNISACE